MKEVASVVPLLGIHVPCNTVQVHLLLLARWVSVLDRPCPVSSMRVFLSMVHGPAIVIELETLLAYSETLPWSDCQRTFRMHYQVLAVMMQEKTAGRRLSQLFPSCGMRVWTSSLLP